MSFTALVRLGLGLVRLGFISIPLFPLHLTIIVLVRIPFKDHSEFRHDKDHSEDWGMGDDGVMME